MTTHINPEAHPGKLVAPMQSMNVTDTGDIKFPITKAKRHPSLTMKALCFFGNDDVRMVDVPKVLITEPKDALIRVTGSTVCGSDLHLLHNEIPGLHKGDILGHECIGIVEEIGPEVKQFKIGDRVAVSAVIQCGECEYCQSNRPSLCDRTNPSKACEALYGHRLGALYGYTEVFGGYEGCQAEFVRVPMADCNLLKLPGSLTDEQAIVLPDIACTGWHANEYAMVGRGDKVVVFGLGPVGMMAAMWAKFRGAAQVIAVDYVPGRLEMARQKLGIEVIDYSQQDVVKTVQKMIPGGPDCVLECVGFRFPTSIIHKIECFIRLETDAPQILNEAITICKKGGRIACIGDYIGYCNHFNIGGLMEKQINFRGGQLFPQAYWKKLLGFIVEGKVDPSFVVTHHMPLVEADKAYRMFDKREDNMVKVLLTAGHP